MVVLLLSSILEHHLPAGAYVDEESAALVSAVVRSHNLLARNVPNSWSDNLLQRLRAKAPGHGQSEVLESMVASLKLARLTLTEGCSSHVAAFARKYFHALVAVWKGHDQPAVRTLVANCIEALVSRSYSCTSEFQNMLKSEILATLQLIFNTKSRSIALQYADDRAADGTDDDSGPHAAGPLFGDRIGFRRRILGTNCAADAQVIALLHSVLSLSAVAYSKYSRTLKSIARKIETLASTVLSLSPVDAMQVTAANLLSSLPHTVEMWGSLMARALNSLENQVNELLNVRPKNRAPIGEKLFASAEQTTNGDAVAPDEDESAAATIRQLLGLRRLVRALLTHRTTGGEDAPSNAASSNTTAAASRGGMMVAIPIGRILSLVEKMIFVPVLNANGQTAAECCVLIREIAFQLLQTLLDVAADDLLPFVKLVERIFRSEIDRAVQRGQRVPCVAWQEAFARAQLRLGPSVGCALADAIVPTFIHCMCGILAKSSQYDSIAASQRQEAPSSRAPGNSGASGSGESDELSEALDAGADSLHGTAKSENAANGKRGRNSRRRKQHVQQQTFKFETPAVHAADAADLISCFDTLETILATCGQLLPPELRHSIESALASWILQVVADGDAARVCPVLRHASCRHALVDLVIRSISVPNRLTRSALLPYAKPFLAILSRDDDSGVAAAALRGQATVVLLLSTGSRLAPLPVSVHELTSAKQRHHVVPHTFSPKPSNPHRQPVDDVRSSWQYGAQAKTPDQATSAPQPDTAGPRQSGIPPQATTNSAADTKSASSPAAPEDSTASESTSASQNIATEHPVQAATPVPTKRSVDDLGKRDQKEASSDSPAPSQDGGDDGGAVKRMRPSEDPDTTTGGANDTVAVNKVASPSSNQTTNSLQSTSEDRFDDDNSSDEEDLPSIVF